MAEDGILLLAGPFLDDGDITGIYIFDIESVEEAQKWQRVILQFKSEN